MKISDNFYTAGQVAELVGVTRVSIWRWIQEGKFNVQRVGGAVLIPKWEVELLLEVKRRKKRNRRAKV